jgi:hypothetical protein
MRKRYIQEPDGSLVEVTQDYSQPQSAPLVFGDLPGYQSPVTGLWVEGRAARREDLKRTGCRPYEGREQEQKEIARYRAYEEQKNDQRAHEAAARAFYQLDPKKQEILRNGGR